MSSEELPYNDFNYQYCIRIAVVGAPKCGKSSLLSSYCCNRSLADFPPSERIHSIGESVYISSQPHQHESSLVRFEYFEIPSSSSHSDLLLHLFSPFMGIVVLFDSTDESALSTLPQFLSYIKHPYQRFVVLANKCESSQRKISYANVSSFLDGKRSKTTQSIFPLGKVGRNTINLSCFSEISVTDNINVFEILNSLQVEILNDLKRESLTSQDLFDRGITLGRQQFKVEELISEVVEKIDSKDLIFY
ncbi:hypothetical protein RCL1_006885 [Eukaryota sp. TZLM3-RCL]